MKRCEAVDDDDTRRPTSDVFPVRSRREAAKLHPRVIMFDLDGTLVDTMGAFADVAAAVMAEHHGVSPHIGRRRYLETSGIPFFEQLEELYPGHPSNAVAARTFEVGKLTATLDVGVSDETRAALAELRARGVKVVVSSNNWQHQVDRFVDRSGVEVDLALGWSAGMHKGAPHFAAVTSRFRVSPSEILFVGDSLHDANLARDVGVPFAARLGTFSEWDFAFQSPGAPQLRAIGRLVDLVEAA